MKLAQLLGSSVIVLTARSGVEALVNLLDEGADDVLRKRFGLEELAARCRTVLVQRLRQDGHLAAAVGSAAEAVDLCREQSPDLLVSAEILEQNTALRLAQQLSLIHI